MDETEEARCRQEKRSERERVEHAGPYKSVSGIRLLQSVKWEPLLYFEQRLDMIKYSKIPLAPALRID